MTDNLHAERRDPEQPEGAFDLIEAAHELLEQARGLAAGRAARTLTPGAGTPLKQTLLAIAAGQRLDEHQAPGPATLHVLVGDVTMRTADHELQLGQHHWAAIPPTPHDLGATTDAVVLLTVGMPSPDAD
jgi:quercetin dioxygenase-like cupin family protein